MPFKAGAIYGQAILNTKQWTAGLTKMQTSTVLGMAAITAAFTTAMIKTGSLVNEWSKELTNVSTLIDTNVISIDKLADQLLHLNPELGNTTELTKGLYEAFSAGSRTAEEAMELTTTAAKFGKAALTDTFTAVDVLSTAINAYGKETVTAEHAANVFFTTIKLGKVVGDELANAIGTSIPLYASVGISLEELTAGMAAMTKQGVHARRSTTQLNAIVNSFLKPSEFMIDQLRGLGYESGAAFLQAEGLVGALKMLEEVTGGDATKIAALLPNIRAMRGVMALSGVGAKEFNYILGEMNNVLGVSQVAFDKQDKVWETAKNALHKVGLVVGEVSKQFIDELLKGVTDVSTRFINLSDSSKEFASTFIVVGAAVGVTTLAVVGLNAAFVALAANPVTAAILGVGLLTTGLITLAKTLNNKKITDADERFKDLAEGVGIATEKTRDLAESMLSLERFFESQAGYKNIYSTIITQQEGMKRQITEIAKRWDIAESKVIAVALTSEKITDDQKVMLTELRNEVIEQERILNKKEAQHRMSLRMIDLYDQRKRDLDIETYLQQEISNALKEQLELSIQIEEDRKEAELLELARIEGVKEARLAAEENYRLSLSETQARIDYSMVTQREALEQNISAAEILTEIIIELGYDWSTVGDFGNKTLERTLRLLEDQRIKLKLLLRLEEDDENQKFTIYQASILYMEILQGKRGASHLALLKLIGDAEEKMSKKITEDQEEELEKRKQLQRDWFSFVSTGTKALISGLSKINSLATQNELDEITLKYQQQSETLQTNLDNGVISQEEYDAQMDLLDQDRVASENKIKKDSFETNKRWELAGIWMSAADAIMSYWASSAKLGPFAGPIAASIMTGLTLALAAKQSSLIKEQKFIPAMEGGGRASGVTRVNEKGGEIFNLPDGTLVIPNDISRQIAQSSGSVQNIINVSFAGANINSDMDLNKIVDQVSRKLGRQLRTA